MTGSRSALHLLLAVTLSLAITVGLAWGGPAAGAGATVDLSRAGQQVPAPTVSAAQPGEPPAAAAGFPEFVDVTSRSGLDYRPNVPTGVAEANSGLYVADIDGDGYEDLLAVGERYPTLFRNTRGAFHAYRTFEVPDVQTAHFFDLDADGDRDLLLAQYAGDLLYYENEGGTFSRAGVELDRPVTNPSSIVSADFTGDGCLDVFVTQNGLWSRTTPFTLAQAQRIAERHPALRPRAENGQPNLLYLGDCESLELASEQAGISGQQWSLVSTAADFTGDGYPDIHVGNDWSTDVLYVNQRDGTFERRWLGPATDRNAMSSTARDLDGDLDLDLFVTNIYYPPSHERTARAPPLNRDAALPDGNNYLVNDGTGNFTDRAPAHSLERGGWGWTATIGDFNNDGHDDVVQTTERVYWIEPYAGVYDTLQVWRGTKASWTKVEGRAVGLNQVNTYSVVRIDYDNDGDLDLAVGTAPLGPSLGSEAERFRLYENQQDDGEALQLAVRDPEGLERNAAVLVETDRRLVYRRVTSNGNYHTQDSRLVHVGTASEVVERVTVRWPDGNRTVYTTLRSGNRYVLTPDEVTRID